MWDYFKRFLGIQDYNRSGNLPETFSNWDYDDLSDDESMDGVMPNHHFFSVFTNPIEMHKFFERQMDEIVKRAFQFNKEIGWDGNEEHPGSLRDEFLKPGVTDKLTKDDDLDGRIGSQEFQSFLDGPKPQPSVYSRQVVIRKIHQPDGTVETTRIERDHTGKEETTITTEKNTNHYDNNLPVTFNDIFSKLLSF